jgi:Uma2 family endonuclease
MATQLENTLPLHRLDADTYRRLLDAGALEGMDVELLDGLLVDRGVARDDPIHRLDVGTYNRMVDTGVFEGRRIELLDGLLVEMSPKSASHILVVGLLIRHFAVAPRWWLQVQDPIEAAFDCEPEPDLLLSDHEPPRGRLLHTARLVVEVAVSSHWLDRGRKAALYAGADIPSYWLVDVPGRAVEVRTQPGPDGYRQCEIYREGDIVPCPLEGVENLDVAALLSDLG